jgi:hypothetical protein
VTRASKGTPNKTLQQTAATGIALPGLGVPVVAAAAELGRSATRAFKMIAFVVAVNGQRICTVGVGDSGVLSAHVSWTGRAGKPGDLDLGIGGLDTRTEEHIRWPPPPEIKVGDSVTIQVIEMDSVDTPIDRKTLAQLREKERVFLTEMEAEHQARIQRKIDEELPPFRAPWELE